MKFTVSRIDGVEVPIIFDEREIKSIEFDTEEKTVDADMPVGFPKNYPGAKATKKTKVYLIRLSFKDGEMKELIFEMADRQLWVQAMNKLSGIDFSKLRSEGHV